MRRLCLIVDIFKSPRHFVGFWALAVKIIKVSEQNKTKTNKKEAGFTDF